MRSYVFVAVSIQTVEVRTSPGKMIGQILQYRCNLYSVNKTAESPGE